MRYATAVGHVRRVAEECERFRRLPWEPLVVAAYVFGELLDGPDHLEVTKMAFALDLPPEEVTWYSEPAAASGFAEMAGIGKLPIEWYWRPAAWPVWNHYIIGPVRFWSLDGPDDDVVAALEQRRGRLLPKMGPADREEERRWLLEECTASLGHLRRVLDGYRDRDRRRDHRSAGREPEDRLWRAAHGYADLREALDRAGPLPT